MSSHRSFRFLFGIALIAVGSLVANPASGGAITVASGTIVSGTVKYVPVSGTAANGSTWASFMSGTTPVSYFVVSGPNDAGSGTQIGSLMFDPKGWSAGLIDFRYGYFGTIGSGTVGPYVYSTGTGNGAVSSTSVERTLPAGTWGAVTTFPARLAGSVSLINSPSLSTSGGNIASTNGWFNQPWSFGAVAPSVTQLLMYSTSAGQGFRAIQSNNIAAPVNLLGYGNGYGMFTWTEAGVSGNRYGAIIPVQAVPEPSSLVLAGLGIAAGGIHLRRRLLRGRPTKSSSAE